MLTDLAITPISRTIHTLAAEQRSGDLLVGSGEAAWMVHFHEGQIVFAESNLKQERLGESLVAAGRITGDQVDQASALIAKSAGELRFGDALVRAGFMQKDAVERLVREWVAKIVLALFRLEAGTASFEDRACSIPQKYRVSLSTHRLLQAGINTMSNSRLLQAGIGPLDRSVRLAPTPRFTFSAQKGSPDEKELLARARAPVALRDLVSKGQEISLTRLRAAYALLASGILQEVDDARSAVGSPADQRQAVSLSHEDRPPIAPVVEPRPPGPSPQAQPPASPAPAKDDSLEIERLSSQINVSLMVSAWLAPSERVCSWSTWRPTWLPIARGSPT